MLWLLLLVQRGVLDRRYLCPCIHGLLLRVWLHEVVLGLVLSLWRCQIAILFFQHLLNFGLLLLLLKFVSGLGWEWSGHWVSQSVVVFCLGWVWKALWDKVICVDSIAEESGLGIACTWRWELIGLVPLGPLFTGLVSLWSLIYLDVNVVVRWLLHFLSHAMSLIRLLLVVRCLNDYTSLHQLLLLLIELTASLILNKVEESSRHWPLLGLRGDGVRSSIEFDLWRVAGFWTLLLAIHFVRVVTHRLPYHWWWFDLLLVVCLLDWIQLFFRSDLNSVSLGIYSWVVLMIINIIHIFLPRMFRRRDNDINEVVSLVLRKVGIELSLGLCVICFVNPSATSHFVWVIPDSTIIAGYFIAINL